MQASSGRIVMAYAGGTAALEAMPALAAAHGDLVAVTLDRGQGKALEAVRDRALAAGAARAHVLDVRDEFARGYILPALRAGALYRDNRSLAPALERSLVAAKLLEIARIERAGAIAHGWTGEHRTAFERAVRTLDARVEIIGPAHAWSAPPPDASPRAPREPALEPATADVAFSRGVPTALNGIEMAVADLMANLATIAAAHGFGAAGAGHEPAAHLALQKALVTLRASRTQPEVDRFAEIAAHEYAELIEGGFWFSPLRAALDAFTAAAHEPVTGLARIRLFKGELQVSAEELASRRLTVVRVKASG